MLRLPPYDSLVGECPPSRLLGLCRRLEHELADRLGDLLVLNLADQQFMEHQVGCTHG